MECPLYNTENIRTKLLKKLSNFLGAVHSSLEAGDISVLTVNTSLRVLLRRICVPGRVQLTIQIRAHPLLCGISQSELELPLRLICSPPLMPLA